MSKVIPKEKLTAYQRWELATFDEHIPLSHQVPLPSPAEPVPDEISDVDSAVGIALPTAEDLERIQQDAWKEGFRLGQEEGHKLGFETGKEESKQLAERLHALVDALNTEQIRQDENLAKEVLALALTVAHQIMGTALRVKPELILPGIREAIAALPTLNGHHRLFVHPDHSRVVNDWLMQEHPYLSWKVIDDTKQSPGGFRVESTHNELDASLPTRWREITKALGAGDNDWLE